MLFEKDAVTMENSVAVIAFDEMVSVAMSLVMMSKCDVCLAVLTAWLSMPEFPTEDRFW